MILVDTSVWVDHLRRGNARLVELLETGTVLWHPFVMGELACGDLKNRSEILSLLEELPQVTHASHKEVLRLVESRQLMGRGLGVVDVHLLASALIDHARLWTLDKRLDAAAERLRIGS